MANLQRVVLFHAPQTRSTGVVTLLEELGADYELRVLNLKKQEQRAPAYLAVNPMGKVPAILHGEALVTEQVAVYLYLADLYPNGRLAPPIGAALRGPYLRWMAFYGSCFEPALIDRAMNREPAPLAMSPYGDHDTMLANVLRQLERGPYFLGDTFSAADVLWGTSLQWMVQFKLVDPREVVTAYVERVVNRPAFVRAAARDAELVAAQSA